MRTIIWVSFFILAITMQSLRADEAPIITSSQNASATTGQFFSYTIAASGTTPITYSAGSLPQGVSQSDEVISGTPSFAGTYNISLSATNAAGRDSDNLTLVVTDPQVAPAITSRLNAAGQVGQPFSYQIGATGTQPINYSALPLPPGLSLNGSEISGTPMQAGFTTVNLGANNAAGSDNEALSLTINVSRELQAPPAITSPLSALATAQAPFKYALTASGTPHIIFTADSLPSGLSFDGATISGRADLAGTFNIPLTASNSIGIANETLVLTVTPPGGADISGAWLGKARNASFDFGGNTGRAATTNDMLRADFTHSGNSLSATFTFSGNGSAQTFAMNGQIGNNSFWLSGTSPDATRTLALSGHVNKKGSAITASGINYGAGSSDEIKISLKK